MEEFVESCGDGYLSSDDGKEQTAQVAFVLAACSDGLRSHLVTICDVTPSLDRWSMKSSFSRLYEASSPTAWSDLDCALTICSSDEIA